MTKNTRRIISVLMAAVLLFTTMITANMNLVFAATSGSCGTNATWNYNTSTKTLTISGTGATKDYRDTNSSILGTEKPPWIEYKESIQKVVVNEGITEIGDYAFFECTALTSVSLPNTLTKLDGWGGAVANVDKTYGCFQACTALTTITLPDSLTEIESYVFNGCTALTKIVIPNNVTKIGKYAFFECSALERVTFGVNVESIGENCFRKTGLKRVFWNDKITSIPNYAFFQSGLVEIEIPDTVTSIGTRSFADCSFLRSITINNPNTTINGDFCNGSNQAITIHGHSGSTAESFVEKYGPDTSYNNEYYFETLDSCAHKVTHGVVIKEAACAEDGIEQIVCDNCGAIVRENAIPALGHDWGEPVETVDSTLENGHVYEAYVCAVCGESKTDVVHQLTVDIDLDEIELSSINIDTSSINASLLNETVYVWIDGYYTKTVVREASCTKTGLERYHCTVDGCSKTETHVVPSHHTVVSWTVTKEPTCTEEGSRRGKCTDCGETITESIAPTGHTYNKDTPTSVYEDVDDGHTHKLYVCDVCGEQIEEYVHNEWVEGCYSVAATKYDNCELPGAELDTCDLCGLRRTQSIPARGEHDYYETSQTEPTCTQRGRIYKACHNCDFTTVEYIDALGHDYVKDESKSTEATCTESGSYFFRCSRCSNSKTETKDALGHDPAEGTWVVDAQPTCTETGTGHGHCQRCDTDYTETIKALGHDYENIETDLTAEGKPGHILSVPTCKRCNTRETGEIVHKEWLEGDYHVTATTPATCTVGATEIRQCKICNYINTVEIEPALGHLWCYKGFISKDVLTNSSALDNLNIPSSSNVNIPDLSNITDSSFFDNINPADYGINGELTDDGIVFTCDVTAEGVQFRCVHCLRTTVKTTDELKALWSFDLLNTAPNRTGAPLKIEPEESESSGEASEGEEQEAQYEEVDKTSYLDLNGDGIINGKDWGYIKTLTAAQEEMIAKNEAQSGETA